MNSQLDIKKKSKGFISLYFVFVLLVVVTFSSYVVKDLNNYLYFVKNLDDFRVMNNIEVLVVRKLIYDFRNYQEKSEVIKYNGAIITIDVESNKAEFTIYYHNLYRERVFVYDSDQDIALRYY